MGNDTKLPSTSSSILVSDGTQDKTWHVPEEIPVAFVYNRRNYAVMLATPADLEDFALGFSLTERVISSADQMQEVDLMTSPVGAELHMSIDEERLERLDVIQRRRNLVGRAGCGLCGLENAETFFEILPPVADLPMEVEQSSLQNAYKSFEAHQNLNEQTKSVHCAAFALPNGEILLGREDVGRHNALDKLIGACIKRDIDMTNGFVLISSRCSYEIIEKCARMNIGAISSISGPTAFAIRKAKEAHIQLYCRNGTRFMKVQPD